MKRTLCLLTALPLAALFSACQPTPEAPIVIEKDTDTLLEQATTDREAAALPLREQLSAPDWMDVMAEDGDFTILAHAAVHLPETDTIPIISVKVGAFSQELIDKLWDLLIGDMAMYQPRTEADRTKAELEEAIALKQSELEGIEQNEFYEENKALREAELAQLQELYRTAPDVYEPVMASSKILEYVASATLADILWGWTQRTMPARFSKCPMNRGTRRLEKAAFRTASFSIVHRDTTASYTGKPAQRRSKRTTCSTPRRIPACPCSPARRWKP